MLCGEQAGPWEGQSRETSEEAIASLQARDDVGLDLDQQQ